ncbi:MAG: hypothetical protein B6U68_02825, partial [Candidatus Aenigmarchaeota archaeon ex4484_14]
MGVVQISFTGGESLLNPDIFDLIKYANKRGFCKAKGQSINISAMVTEKNIKELPEIVSFAKSLGINIFLSPVMYSHYSDDYGFRPKGNGYLDKEKVMETYSALKRQYFSSGMMTPPYYLRLSEKYLISQKNKWNCKAGLVFFDI